MVSDLVFVETTEPGLQALDLARQAGHRAILLRSPRYDFYMPAEKRARVHERADLTVEIGDPYDTAAMLAGLSSAGIDPSGVGGVLSTMHMCALPAARLAAEVGAPGPDPAAVAAAKDKVRCRRMLDAAGIDDLAFAVAESVPEALDAADRIGFPVAVKPAGGFAKVSAAITRTAQEVRAHLAAVEAAVEGYEPGVAAELDGRFIVEEVAVGPLYSVEVAADGRAITPLVVVRRKTGRDNPILELGSTVPSGLPEAPEREIGDHAARVCRALGLTHGIFHIEIILTSRGPRLIEVNPRIAGGAIPDLVAAATGQNLFGLLVDLATGGPAPAEPLKAIAGASHSFITAAEDCDVRADLPADWFERFRPRIHSGWTKIVPGARLRRMDGNLDVYGVVRVVAEDFRTAERACVELIGEVETTLGVRPAPIAQATLPEGAR